MQIKRSSVAGTAGASLFLIGLYLMAPILGPILRLLHDHEASGWLVWLAVMAYVLPLIWLCRRIENWIKYSGKDQ